MTTVDLLVMYKSFNLDKTKVSKWSKHKENIIMAASDIHKRKLFKIRSSVKYQSLYKELYAQFTEARSKGYHVDFNWPWSKGRKIHRNQTGDETAILRKHVIANLLKRNNLKRRKIQRNKKLPKEHYRADLVKWHYNLRERAIRTGAANHSYDSKWRSYLPVERFNMDHSPLPFARDTSTTYEKFEKRNKKNRNQKVWAVQPKQGDSKRFCTLNICFRPSGEQPRLAIIFRGKGLRLSAVEKASSDKDVDVFFQPNAWADTEFVVNWAEKTLKPAVADVSYFILFLDNLEAHVHESFRKSVSNQKGITWFGVPGATDIWQPVDGGHAATLKALINQQFFDWLDDDENIQKWYGEKSHITASEKRILVTHWAGNAYRKLCDSRYENFRWRLFEKTGCLSTADGSEDAKVSPEGLLNYELQPPIDIDPIGNPATSSTVPPSEPNIDEEEEDNFEGENEYDNVEIVQDDDTANDGWIFDLFDV